jgi:hypothetical protein
MKVPESMETPQLPGDQAKLMVIKNDFDKQIEPFLSLREAQKYKELMHTYIATADARNSKILELNAIYAELAELEGLVFAKEQEIRDIDRDAFSSFDPQLPLVRTFLDGASRQSKSQVAKLIYFMKKAYQYYAGEQDPIEINDSNVALLRSAATSIRFGVAEAKRGFGRPVGTFQRKGVRLDKLLTRSAWDQLRQTGRFGFVIPRNAAEFVDYNLILVRRVEFVFEGLRSKQRVVKILHHGKSVVQNTAGEWVEFSHLPVTAIGETDANGTTVSNGSITELKDDEYAGVSPFGPWTVGVRVPRLTDLRAISGVTVFFDGAGFPS